jgi:hypothetical protein
MKPISNQDLIIFLNELNPHQWKQVLASHSSGGNKTTAEVLLRSYPKALSFWGHTELEVFLEDVNLKTDFLSVADRAR